ncbi:lysozyme 1B-like [Teleopsis dalmanni]|uniref:lysozyme 1B-like n=1 Tax=Teleopsis dalmanni TaxID=139649 RepID=UPI0018CD14E8|nr:lysozyme 1B-like [Teleopsis dalmanni]
MSILIIISLLIISQNVYARRLKRCELAGELYILDVPKAELPLWICIAEYESRFNTHVIGRRNDDGSSDYGLFQISDKFWCNPANDTEYYVFNECNVNCTELITDDITKAVICARTILKQQGWSAWTVYEEFCNTTLTDADACFE